MTNAQIINEIANAHLIEEIIQGVSYSKFENPENKKQKINENLEKIYCDKLNEKYFKIKESLSRCGNKVIQFEEKEEVEKIINSFFNTRKELNKI